MDVTAMAFYALVCGGLGAMSPRLPSLWQRFTVAALVGIVAAALLPMLPMLRLGSDSRESICR